MQNTLERGQTLGTTFREFRQRFNDASERSDLRVFIKKPNVSKAGFENGSVYEAVIGKDSKVCGKWESGTAELISVVFSMSPHQKAERILRTLKQVVAAIFPNERGDDIVTGLHLSENTQFAEIDAWFEKDGFIYKITTVKKILGFLVTSLKNPGAEALKLPGFSGFDKNIHAN